MFKNVYGRFNRIIKKYKNIQREETSTILPSPALSFTVIKIKAKFTFYLT